MTPRVRLTLQVGTIGAALWLMAGCFYLPASNKAVDGTSLPEDIVGAADSGKPLLVHQSTRDDADRVLPNRLRWSPNRRYAIYVYNVRVGYTVWPLCFAAQEDTEWKFLQLRFSPDGRLDGFDTFDNQEWALRDTGITTAQLYSSPRARRPDPLTPEQESKVRDHLAARRQAETRPTAAPDSRPPEK